MHYIQTATHLSKTCLELPVYELDVMRGHPEPRLQPVPLPHRMCARVAWGYSGRFRPERWKEGVKGEGRERTRGCDLYMVGKDVL